VSTSFGRRSKLRTARGPSFRLSPRRLCLLTTNCSLDQMLNLNMNMVF
jgi:hypothetical protein